MPAQCYSFNVVSVAGDVEKQRLNDLIREIAGENSDNLSDTNTLSIKVIPNPTLNK